MDSYFPTRDLFPDFLVHDFIFTLKSITPIYIEITPRCVIQTTPRLVFIKNPQITNPELMPHASVALKGTASAMVTHALATPAQTDITGGHRVRELARQHPDYRCPVIKGMERKDQRSQPPPKLSPLSSPGTHHSKEAYNVGHHMPTLLATPHT